MTETIAGVDIPDTELAREATELVRKNSTLRVSADGMPPPLCHDLVCGAAPSAWQAAISATG